MRIGIIGAGNIGESLATLLVRAGHEVVIANSRGPDSLADLVGALGERASAATVADAARIADVVIEAIPFGKLDTLPKEELAGKVLITAANYYGARDGELDFGGRTQSEYLHAKLPRTHVAKAFNTIWFQHLRVEGDTSKPMEARRVIPFAASDREAEEAARTIIESLGFGPLFLGDLSQTRDVSEPGGLLYNKQLTVAEATQLLTTRRTSSN